MQWYEGDIAEAVSMSKMKNAVFVVYVEGKDDKSVNLTSLINDEEVSSKLESNTFVAIRVEAGSISHNQFAAIYKTVPVPSLFFIGKNGKPLDIILESSSVSDLSGRINSIIGKHTGVLPVVPQQSTSTKSSEDLINNEKQSTSVNTPEEVCEKPIEENIEKPVEEKCEKVEVKHEESEKQCENGVCLFVPKSSSSSMVTAAETIPSSSTTNEEFLEQEKKELSKEEKVQRAKELVEIKREAKKQDEEETAKQKELERRKTGQDVQKLRRWQQDQELKNIMEERQRAKIEEKVARDRILAQIAQDKADRAAKFGSPPPSSSTSSHQTDYPPKPPINSSVNLNTARLQFKLPDGTTKTQNFKSSDTLQEVLNYVATLNLPYRNYTLSTTFPRREFTAEDVNSSLRDLELCPNAVILVLPINTASAVVSPQGGGFMTLIWFLLSPILGVFDYFKNLIFGSSNNNTQPPPNSNKRDSDEVAEQQPESSMKRKVPETSVIRRQGNIHRLSDRTDSDDDNNTWNGNSTQQM